MSKYIMERMRTTVRLEDNLLLQAKEAALRREMTLTAVLEEALREWLARQRKSQRRERVDLPISNAGGRVRPGVDLDDAADLLDRMEEDDPS